MQQSNALPIGTHIESYEILSILGTGGFGITYKAQDHSLKQVVAIKEYLPYGLTSRYRKTNVRINDKKDQAFYQQGLVKFLNEARTLAKFRNPNIVRVSRYIQANNTAYLIMDFEKGWSLTQKITHQAILNEQAIYCLMTPILQGLSTIHEQSMLHRDIKPANIILRETGEPVLIDFGSARQAMQQQTVALTTMVSPGYAPFEQYTNEPQGPWTDLYGLGATLYYCMSGTAPTVATQRIAALYQKKPDPIESSFQALTHHYSAELTQLIRWMLKIQANERPQTVHDVLMQLPQNHLIANHNNNDDIDVTRIMPADNAIPKTNTNPVLNSHDPIPASPNTIDAQTITILSQSLAEELGPIAKILVKKAHQTNDNLDGIIQTLLVNLPTEQQRTKFIEKTGLSSNYTQLTEKSHTTTKAVYSQKQTTTHNTEITNEITQHITKQLSLYLGPVAKFIVKKKLKTVQSKEDLVEALSKEIEDNQHRLKFIRGVT
ncbi:MAG: serine/threonine-protein kinase [bacterium]